MKNPMRLAFLIATAAALTLPGIGQAQENGRVTKAALTASETGAAARHHHGVVAQDVRKSETATKAEKHARKTTATSRARVRVRKGAVPRSAFEDRTAHYFDPLSLTLAPETRIDPAKTQYNQVVGKFVPSDSGEVAVAPDDPTTHQISSASIENLEQGHNVTIVVPLFKILNNFSDQPPPAAEQ